MSPQTLNAQSNVSHKEENSHSTIFTQDGHVHVKYSRGDGKCRTGFISLEGPWLFKRGEDPSYRHPDTPDSEWEIMQVPQNWLTLSEEKQYHGTGWYRLHINFSPLPAGCVPAIELGFIDDADKTYFNGHLIGTTGEFPKVTDEQVNHAYDKKRIYAIPEKWIHKGKDNVLAVKVHSMDYDTAGIYKGKVRLGTYQELLEHYYSEGMFLLVIASIYFILGLYFLFLFFRRRDRWENLIIFVFLVILAIVTFLRGDIKYHIIDNFHVLKLTEYIFELLLPPIFFHFVLYYFDKKKHTPLSNILDGITILSVIFLGLNYRDLVMYFSLSRYVSYWLMLIYLLYSLLLLFINRKSRNDARIMLYGFAVFTGTFIFDIIDMFFAFSIPWISHYGFLAFVFSVVTAMGNRYAQLLSEKEQTEKDLRNYQDRLEALVKERTKELQAEIDIRKATEQSLRTSREALQKRNDIFERDMRSAQYVHSTFLPKSPPDIDGLHIEFRHIPLKMIGGDYFSFTQIDETKLGVFIGDVTGHGVSAALFLSLLKGLSERTCTRHGTSPINYIKAMNTDVMKNMPGLYFTALYGVFEIKPDAATFTFTRAGHPFPVLFRKDTEHTVSISAGGPLIGVTPDIKLDETTVYLGRGDRFFFYTDGIPEAENENRKMLGHENITPLIARSITPSLEETLERIISKTVSFMGEKEFDDDVVLIGIEITGPQ